MNFNFVKSSSVYETFSPLYKVLKLFGMIPFEMNMKSGKVSVKNHDLLWVVAAWVLWTCLIIWNVQLGAREPGEDSKIILTGWHWLLIFELFACFYVQIVNFLSRKRVGKLFKILDEVDRTVRNLFFKNLRRLKFRLFMRLFIL